MHQPTRILIIASLDKSASNERATVFKSYFEKDGFQVDIFDTVRYFSRMVQSRYLKISPGYYLDYLRGLAYHKLNSYYPLFEEMQLRGKIISDYVRKTNPKIVICQNPQDMGSLLSVPLGCYTILDSPTIFSEEVKLENKVCYKDFLKIKALENKVFKDSDKVIFHWSSFFDFIKKQKRIITHPFTADWGCTKREQSARYSTQPKILYLGKLNSNWVNPPLLEGLQKKSPLPFDIYSYETPDDHYFSLQTKGYLANLDRIATYQFGLITTSHDELRNSGFSAKHLQYISYGLPVFCPKWRKDKILSPATIYYDEDNFNEQIRKYSQRENWTIKHLAAMNLAKQLNWQKTLSPLISEMKNLILPNK